MFEEIHQVVIDGISDIMDSLIQSIKNGSIDTSDTSKNEYYVIKFISEAYTMQNNTTIGGNIITAGELFVKTQYICSIQDITNWYC